MMIFVIILFEIEIVNVIVATVYDIRNIDADDYYECDRFCL